MNERIYLSPPNVGEAEEKAAVSVLKGGWVAPVGPKINEFESTLSSHFHGKKVLLLNSGTAALHLSMLLAGVQPGDTVVTSSLTFAACANVILYEKATPVFLDSETDSWNMDPVVLEEYLSKTSQRPKAIIVTHLYGVSASISKLVSIAKKYKIAVIEDAAEAVGAAYKGQQLGTFGHYGILSFNGNKIVTSGGGGALICDDADYKKGLHLATQANTGNALGMYEHDAPGYNYRLSNVLASVGAAQFQKLTVFMDIKSKIAERYKRELASYLTFPEAPDYSMPNYWLTTAILKTPFKPADLFDWLQTKNIESRRIWKPLHLQKAYRNFEFIGSGTCENIFNRGICLPSGTGLSASDQSRVIQEVKKFFEA